MVKASAESLLAVINDILDFSKIEAGKLELDVGRLRPARRLGDTMKTLALRAQQKGLELACHVAPDVPEALVGDPGRLRQVLVNLVGNAIKFTERGEVVVDVRPETRTERRDLPALRRARHRHRHPAEKQQAASSRPFAQADSSTTRKYGGTGLGLTISAQLRRLMGGRIWVESEPGQGSTFHFTARFGLTGTARRRRRRSPIAPARPARAGGGRQRHQPPHPRGDARPTGGCGPTVANGGAAALAVLTRGGGGRRAVPAGAARRPHAGDGRLHAGRRASRPTRSCRRPRC